MSEAAQRGCPDGGFCNQFGRREVMCPGSCWRVRHDRPLYGRYPGDRWPDELVAAQYPAWHMLTSVAGALHARYGSWEVTGLPGGLRLEVHPAMYCLVMQDPDGTEHGLGDVGSQLGVPVKVTTGVPQGSWRLVMVTEDVLLEWKP